MRFVKGSHSGLANPGRADFYAADFRSHDSHQVEARGGRPAIAAGLRKLASNAGWFLGLSRSSLSRSLGEGGSDRFNVEVLDRHFGENCVVHLVCDEFIRVRILFRCSCFAGLRFGQGRHGHIDVLEDAARSDAQYAFERFDQIVSLAATVLSSEVIDEGESGVELFGVDEKASTVGFPFKTFHWRAPMQFCFWYQVLNRLDAGWNKASFFV